MLAVMVKRTSFRRADEIPGSPTRRTIDRRWSADCYPASDPSQAAVRSRGHWPSIVRSGPGTQSGTGSRTQTPSCCGLPSRHCKANMLLGDYSRDQYRPERWALSDPLRVSVRFQRDRRTCTCSCLVEAPTVSDSRLTSLASLTRTQSGLTRRATICSIRGQKKSAPTSDEERHEWCNVIRYKT